ncbi:MAG TPA: fibronectin type III domain-containing protein [Pyrinomonadaceae bacterium]|nr:fibronectin type III domain-containing protein [Pyrinomonadaceae bacterium]
MGEDPAQFVVGYNVYQSLDPTLPKDQWEKVNDKPVPGTKFTQSHLEPGMTYYYYATSVNAFGRESVPSDVTSATVRSSDEDETESPTFLN